MAADRFGSALLIQIPADPDPDEDPITEEDVVDDVEEELHESLFPDDDDTDGW